MIIVKGWSSIKRTLGHMTLPIPDGVSDQNKVNFGDGTLNPVHSCWFADVALKFLLEGCKRRWKMQQKSFKKSS